MCIRDRFSSVRTQSGVRPGAVRIWSRSAQIQSGLGPDSAQIQSAPVRTVRAQYGSCPDSGGVRSRFSPGPVWGNSGFSPDSVLARSG
eukprot:3493123-Alexandrium_andersonii.AAC.1